MGGSRKKGGLGQFADLSGKFGKKEGVVFLRGVDTPVHFMVFRIVRLVSRIFKRIPITCTYN